MCEGRWCDEAIDVWLDAGREMAWYEFYFGKEEYL